MLGLPEIVEPCLIYIIITTSNSTKVQVPPSIKTFWISQLLLVLNSTSR